MDEEPLVFLSGKEFIEAAENSHGDWGPWRLDPATLVLTTVEGWWYEVDLERCLTSAGTLDWIFQVATKNWATPACMAGLVRALDDVLEPQATLCSWGRSKHLTRKDVQDRVRRWAERWPELTVPQMTVPETPS